MASLDEEGQWKKCDRESIIVSHTHTYDDDDYKPKRCEKIKAFHKKNRGFQGRLKEGEQAHIKNVQAMEDETL